MRKRAKNKVMLNAWVDDRLMAGLDQFLKGYPQMNRSKVLVQALVTFLSQHGMPVPPEVLVDFRPKKPLRPDALFWENKAAETTPSTAHIKPLMPLNYDPISDNLVESIFGKYGMAMTKSEHKKLHDLALLAKNFFELGLELGQRPVSTENPKLSPQPQNEKRKPKKAPVRAVQMKTGKS